MTAKVNPCDECGRDLNDMLREELGLTPAGQRRIILICPQCGTVHTVNLGWTPHVVREQVVKKEPQP